MVWRLLSLCPHSSASWPEATVSLCMHAIGSCCCPVVEQVHVVVCTGCRIERDLLRSHFLQSSPLRGSLVAFLSHSQRIIFEGSCVNHLSHYICVSVVRTAPAAAPGCATEQPARLASVKHRLVSLLSKNSYPMLYVCVCMCAYRTSLTLRPCIHQYTCTV